MKPQLYFFLKTFSSLQVHLQVLFNKANEPKEQNIQYLMQMTGLDNLVMYTPHNYALQIFHFETRDNKGCDVANILEGAHGADCVSKPIGLEGVQSRDT